MRKMIFVSMVLSSSFAFAHGSKPEQAADAIKEATKIFVASTNRAVLNTMTGVHALNVGHEKFEVTFDLRGNPTVKYTCVENESQAGAGIITWDCLKN